MILATRPVIFEPYLGGLDKMYRLHKWLGISGLVMSIAHWLCTQAPKWFVSLGWIGRPARQAQPEQTLAVFRYFQSQRGLAEAIGEWAFYATVVPVSYTHLDVYKRQRLSLERRLRRCAQL